MKLRMTKNKIFATVVVSLTTLFVAVACGGGGDDVITIGHISTLEGAFTVLGQDSQRGFELALDEFDRMVGGKQIEFIYESSGTGLSPDDAVAAARKLVEQDGADIIIGPLSGDEGIAIKDYAKTVPDVTFINGASAAQDTTLRDPAPNFFRFSTDGAQWMAGLGAYVYNERDYRNISIVAENYSFPYTQVQGFLLPYCELGGTVASRSYVPIGTQDYSSVINTIPATGIDAVYVALGGADAINFLTQYTRAGRSTPLIGGSITVDQTVLGAEANLRASIVGTPSAGPIADNLDTLAWTAFVAQYREAFPDGFPSPSLFAHANYVNTKAALIALAEVDGDLSDDGANFRAALAEVEFDTPTGRVSLDDNRQAVADIYITQVAMGDDGNFFNEVVQTVSQVNQTLGIDREEFLANGVVGPDNPECN